jgi:hypothetical protein
MAEEKAMPNTTPSGPTFEPDDPAGDWHRAYLSGALFVDYPEVEYEPEPYGEITMAELRGESRPSSGTSRSPG